MRERARRQLVALGVAVAVLVLAGVVALWWNRGGGEVEAGDTTTSAPAGPGAPTPPDGPGFEDLGLDPAHPLVGRPESEVRTVHPLVRVAWRDGEPLMLTQDLRPGRVDVAVRDGVVVAAAAEGCDDLPDGAPGWVRAACDPSPDDGATVWGTLRGGDAGGLALEPDPDADRYYEGLAVAGAGDIPLLVDLEGAPLTAGELRDGQRVWLWIDGPCAESFPVRCDVAAMVVSR